MRNFHLSLLNLVFRDYLQSFDFLQACPSLSANTTGLSICKVCVCLHQPPADGTKAAVPFVPTVSSFLLRLSLCRAGGTIRGPWLPVTRILLGSLEAKAQTVYSCLARRGEYFGLCQHYFWFVLSYKCLLFQLHDILFDIGMKHRERLH